MQATEINQDPLPITRVDSISQTDATGVDWGAHVNYEEYSVESNYFGMGDPNYDGGCEFWPMSEEQFNNLLPSRGFRDANGPTYRDYLKQWFKDAASKSPTSEQSAAAYQMLKDRKEQLAQLRATGKETPFEIGKAERHVEVAIEVYGWARGAEWAKKHGEVPLPIFEGFSYFEPFRVSPGLDYWVVPLELRAMLVETIERENGNNPDSVLRVALPPPDVSFEITYDPLDSSEPSKVIYCKKVPNGFAAVSTRKDGVQCRECWLDGDELLKRRKASQQAERDDRKRQRDSEYAGNNYFDIVFPTPNPVETPGFNTMSINQKMNLFPKDWSAADKYRACLVASGSKSKYQQAREMMFDMANSSERLEQGTGPSPDLRFTSEALSSMVKGGLSACPKCAERAATICEPEEDGTRRAECASCGYKFKLVSGQ